MRSLAQAVLEFDEEVQAPWRPRLVQVATFDDTASTRAPLSLQSRRSPSRVGGCRPSVAPAPPAHRSVTPRPEAHARCIVPPASRSSGGRRPVAPASASTVGLRLTRRARRLGVAMALAVGVAVGSWVGPLLGGGSDGLRLAGESSVVVQPGDTLWSIASSLGGAGDVRALIDEIQALNDLPGGDLVPGQMLLLP